MQTGTFMKNGNLSTEEFKCTEWFISIPPKNRKKAFPEFQRKKMLPHRSYGYTGRQIKFNTLVLMGVVFH